MQKRMLRSTSVAAGTSKSRSKTFRGTLEVLRGSGLNWVITRLPFSVEKTWGSRGIFKVQVEINGFKYRTSLFPTQSGQHFLLVNKKMQKEARILVGSTASFTVTPDLSPREVKLPPELEQALREDRQLWKWFARLPHSLRKWFSDTVEKLKGIETRKRRAAQIAEHLMETMDAEHELPPMIRLAFNRNPGAQEGWRMMTPTQRRSHLMGIFYYKTPQARTRRLEKAIEQAMSVLEKQRGARASGSF